MIIIALSIVALLAYRYREYFKREVETDYHWYGKNDDTRVTNYQDMIFGK